MRISTNIIDGIPFVGIRGEVEWIKLDTIYRLQSVNPGITQIFTTGGPSLVLHSFEDVKGLVERALLWNTAIFNQ